MSTSPMKMVRAVSDILECLEQAKKVKSLQELLPYVMFMEPLQTGIQSFFEETLKPIHDALEKGEEPFLENKKTEEKEDFDWNKYFTNINPGKVN